MKKNKFLHMAISFIVICLLFLLAFVNNKRFNADEQVLTFGDDILKDEGVSDHNISVKIQPRGYKTNDLSSWYHTFHAKNKKGIDEERTAVGTIYELEISNLTSNVVSEWHAEITMPVETHFNSGWNGDFGIHQNVKDDEKTYDFNIETMSLDDIHMDYIYDQAVLLIPMHKGDYFTYEPSIVANETPIDATRNKADGFSKKTIGFIMYTEHCNTDYAIKFSNGSITYRINRKITHEILFWFGCIGLGLWIIWVSALGITSFKLRKLKIKQAAQEEMIHKFEEDDLTKTLTRQAFFHYGDKRLENTEKKYATALVEIDNFKITHSQYGETICNEFLIYLANYLMELFPDGYIGRYSRSRYSIIYEIDENHPFDVEKIISSEMIKSSPMPNQVLKLAVYSPVESGITIRRCFDRVALALSTIRGIYGQNIANYDDSLENKLLDDHKIEEYMEEALSKRQFVVYYQPKHDTENKTVIGAEALVRWIHPQYGFMSPAQFIPIFERTGFITKLDAYVFETVCHDIKEWDEKGICRVPVSVNVSRKDFYEDEWIESRLKYIEDNKVDTSLLHVEVTESSYAEDTDMIRTKVELLKEKGIKIEMDDFGSGYSSLGMLAGLSLDTLKLDISFVKDIDKTEVVVDSIIGMAHKLGLSVVSEGVETEDQYQVMKDHGCDMIQGYYFAKPMTKEEFEEYIR